jgi:hypothetical protein
VSPEECHRRVLEVRQRSCEGGIPMAYMQGLHECYRKFVATMRDEGSFVVARDWSHFGAVDDVAAAILATPDSRDFLRNAAALRSFIEDSEAVERVMRLPHTIEDDEVNYDAAEGGSGSDGGGGGGGEEDEDEAGDAIGALRGAVSASNVRRVGMTKALSHEDCADLENAAENRVGIVLNKRRVGGGGGGSGLAVL